MGQQPTEEELFQMISEVDEDMSGAIGTEASPLRKDEDRVADDAFHVCIP
jgi:hypothetical protein